MTSTEAPVAVVLGAGGQLGHELCASAPSGWHLVALARGDLDITDRPAVHARLADLGPAVVVNAAAFTAVDAAESAPALAHAVNADGAANVAAAARSLGARLVHVSTDFVFDGALSRPYGPDAVPNPLSVYGQSKLAGEEHVLRLAGDQCAIVRTGWVYSAHGQNFVKTMLRLLQERGTARVVADQVGTPTWAGGLAAALWAIAQASGMNGIWHWADAGVASWYDFAEAIRAGAQRLDMLPPSTTLVPIATSEFPAAAARPSFSVLDASQTRHRLGLSSQHWSAPLSGVLAVLQDQP